MEVGHVNQNKLDQDKRKPGPALCRQQGLAEWQACWVVGDRAEPPRSAPLRDDRPVWAGQEETPAMTDRRRRPVRQERRGKASSSLCSQQCRQDIKA